MTETLTKPLNPAAFREDELVPWSQVAKRVGVSGETLKTWHRKYHVPAITTPEGYWLGYQSWIDAVITAALPGRAPSIAEITELWWIERTIKEVA